VNRDEDDTTLTESPGAGTIVVIVLGWLALVAWVTHVLVSQ
jgi:hypothetical protein